MVSVSVDLRFLNCDEAACVCRHRALVWAALMLGGSPPLVLWAALVLVPALDGCRRETGHPSCSARNFVVRVHVPAHGASPPHTPSVALTASHPSPVPSGL